MASKTVIRPIVESPKVNLVVLRSPCNRLANKEKNRIKLSKCDISLWDIMIDVHKKNQRNR